MMGADYHHVCNLHYNLMTKVQEMHLSLSSQGKSFVLRAIASNNYQRMQ